MIRLASFVLSAVLISQAGQCCAAPLQSGSLQGGLAGSPSAVMLPAGTRIELAVTAPVWAKTARPGDPLYTQTNFPVTIGDSIAIPAGTYVEGRIEAVTPPTRKTSRAELRIAFTKIIFANGYTIVLPDVLLAPATSSPDAGPAATVALVTAETTTANDLLLDNGAQIEMTLAAPLAQDARQVANAVPLSRAPEPGKFTSATLCRPTPSTPGTPGTSDTVIPGSPGTPSTTIPGGPNMPDITIPGTPATPDTVIPGSPGTPGFAGTVCPAAPIVISSVPVAAKPAQGQSSMPVTK